MLPSKEKLKEEYQYGFSFLTKKYDVSDYLLIKLLSQYNIEFNECKCGCGRKENYRDYISGHNPQNHVPHSEETKKIISAKARERFKRGQKVNCKIYNIPLKEDLEFLYNELGLPASKVCKIMGTSQPTLKKWFKKYGIKIRGVSESLQISYKKGNISSDCIELDECDLEYLFNERGYSCEKISYIMGVSPTTIIKRLKNIGIDVSGKRTSSGEVEIQELLTSNNVDFVSGDNNFIYPKEIDIIIYDRKIGIEYDGIVWHSEISPFGTTGKSKSYHLDKTIECEQRGFQLFHIFDNEWLNPIKRKIWESVILDSLGIYEYKIGARQTEIKEISAKEANLFCEENHLQGSCLSSINYGLTHKNELVSIMTFGKSRYNSGFDWELLRFCSKKSHKIHGAASKLLNHFRKHNNGSIISYANRRWSKGKLYEKLGFKKIDSSGPNYFYWKDTINLESRIKYQKHKLKDLIDNVDISLSEWENMKNNGYNRVFDCGNLVYILN